LNSLLPFVAFFTCHVNVTKEKKRSKTKQRSIYWLPAFLFSASAAMGTKKLERTYFFSPTSILREIRPQVCFRDIQQKQLQH
jgi:hypothetical protein